MHLSNFQEHLAKFLPSSSSSSRSSLEAGSFRPSTANTTSNPFSSTQPRPRRKSSVVHAFKRMIPRRDSFTAAECIHPVPMMDADRYMFLTTPHDFNQTCFEESFEAGEAKICSSLESIRTTRRPKTATTVAESEKGFWSAHTRHDQLTSGQETHQSLRRRKSSLKLCWSSHKNTHKQQIPPQHRIPHKFIAPAHPFNTPLSKPQPQPPIFPLSALPGVIPPTSSDNLLVVASNSRDIPYASFSSSRSSIASLRISRDNNDDENDHSMNKEKYVVNNHEPSENPSPCFSPSLASPPLGRPHILPYSSTESFYSSETSMSSISVDVDEWEEIEQWNANYSSCASCYPTSGYHAWAGRVDSPGASPTPPPIPRFSCPKQPVRARTKREADWDRERYEEFMWG